MLQSIFELLTRTYAELEEPASPHFQLCLSILETVSQVGERGACIGVLCCNTGVLETVTKSQRNHFGRRVGLAFAHACC